VSPSVEAFLDQLTVWRELAFNGCAWTAARGWDAIPDWARKTLEAHLDDPRPHLYTDEQLATAARTIPFGTRRSGSSCRTAGPRLHADGLGQEDPGRSAHPAEALDRMERLMDRYSLDGRDPVSYASYGWVLGRYDRPWFERPIFGTVRYVTSESTARKLRLKQWLARYGPTRACCRSPRRASQVSRSAAQSWDQP
jgi:deoxyribodipyrimidine photo-lyase